MAQQDNLLLEWLVAGGVGLAVYKLFQKDQSEEVLDREEVLAQVEAEFNEAVHHVLKEGRIIINELHEGVASSSPGAFRDARLALDIERRVAEYMHDEDEIGDRRFEELLDMLEEDEKVLKEWKPRLSESDAA